MDKKLPKFIIAILLDWFTKCKGVVRWGNDISDVFSIAGRLRQGSLCSPILFAVYIDTLIEKLERVELAAELMDSFLGVCVMQMI